MSTEKEKLQEQYDFFDAMMNKNRIESSWEDYIELTIANFGHIPNSIQEQIDEKIRLGISFIPSEDFK